MQLSLSLSLLQDAPLDTGMKNMSIRCSPAMGCPTRQSSKSWIPLPSRTTSLPVRSTSISSTMSVVQLFFFCSTYSIASPLLSLTLTHTHTHTQRPMTDGFGLEHPTQYFLESRRLRGGATVKSEQGSSVGAGRQQRDSHEDTTQATADETMDMSTQDLDDFIGEEDAMQ